MRKALLIIFFILYCTQAFAGQQLAKPTSEAVSEYPQIATRGYKKWLYSDIKVEPQRNYYLYISTQEAWRRGNGPWMEFLNLSISSGLSADLQVDYNVFQSPFGRDKYDVQVCYKDYRLSFGDINQYLFINREFFAHDFINGGGISGKWEKWKIGIISSAVYPRSNVTGEYKGRTYFRGPRYYGDKIQIADDNQNLEYWSLDFGRVDIQVEDVEIFIDGERLSRGKVFVTDGLVLFPAIYKDNKEAKVVLKLKNSEKEERTFNIKREARRQAFSIPYDRILDYSEEMAIDGVKLIRSIDYKIDYNVGLLILNQPIPEDAEVRIDYRHVYTQAKQEVFGGSVEYELADWNKIGISYIRISPSITALTVNPFEFTILNLYNRTDLGENTYIIGELSSGGSTVESGTAVKVEGRTKLGGLALSAVYRNVEPDFASVKRVRQNVKSKYNESSLNAEYAFSEGFKLRVGFGSIITQEGTATLESKESLSSFGLTWKPLSNWLSEVDFKTNRGATATETLRIYQQIGLIDRSPFISRISKNSDIILKYYLIKKNGDAIRTQASKYQYGWQNDFVGGLSTYLDWSNEENKDLISGTSVQNAIPFCRASYVWKFWEGWNLEIYSAYSATQQRGLNTSSDKQETSYGLLCKMPQENPILSSIRLGMESKTTNYDDRLNLANNYKASEIRFEGVLEF